MNKTWLNHISITLIPYSLCVSGLYLIGYWGTFNVNVFEFIGVNDLIKLAIYPFFAGALSFLVGYSLAEIVKGNQLEVGAGSSSKFAEFCFKYAQKIFAALLIVILIVAFFVQEPRNWLLVAFLASIFHLPLAHSEYCISVIPNPRLRHTILFLAIMLPGLSFYYGKQNAFYILNGNPLVTVDIARTKLELKSSEKLPVAYLGHLGEIYFVYESTSKTVVLIKQSDEAPIYLSQSSKYEGLVAPVTSKK